MKCETNHPDGGNENPLAWVSCIFGELTYAFKEVLAPSYISSQILGNHSDTLRTLRNALRNILTSTWIVTVILIPNSHTTFGICFLLHLDDAVSNLHFNLKHHLIFLLFLKHKQCLYYNNIMGSIIAIGFRVQNLGIISWKHPVPKRNCEQRMVGRYTFPWNMNTRHLFVWVQWARE